MNLLDRLLGRSPSPQEGTSWEQRTFSNAAEAVAGYYLSEKEKGEIFNPHSLEDTTLLLLPVLERHLKKDAETNAFLEDLVDAMDSTLDRARKSKKVRSAYDFQVFLTAVTQALYCKNRNDLVLDLRPLGRHFDSRFHRYFADCWSDHQSFGFKLFGTEERPLRMKVLGDVSELGGWASHCVIGYGGKANKIGKDAHDARFILSGELGEIGSESEHCVYELESPATVAILGESNKVYAGNGLTTVKGGVLWDFFEKNELYVPDGSGGWRQARSLSEVIINEAISEVLP